LYFPTEVDVDAATAVALRAQNPPRARDPPIEKAAGATTPAGASHRFYANSHGFVGGFPTSTYSTSCSVVARSGESLERDYWYTLSRKQDELESPESVGAEAARRALQRLGARQLATRVVPVIFPPELAKSVFGHLVGAVRGTAQYRRASFLIGAAGKAIFPSIVQIDEEPLIPRALGSAPFDGEGVATRSQPLVTDGVLVRYVLSSYSARRLGLATTGNAGGVHNLVVRPTAGSLEELIAACDEAFVVGELLGHGVNNVTGDYSRGAAGFWVERGRIAYPVNEVTIAGNLADMFRNVRAIGSDVDVRGSIRCGSLLIDGLTVAGQ
jgi:PmbA protein